MFEKSMSNDNVFALKRNQLKKQFSDFKKGKTKCKTFFKNLCKNKPDLYRLFSAHMDYCWFVLYFAIRLLRANVFYIGSSTINSAYSPCFV